MSYVTKNYGDMNGGRQNIGGYLNVLPTGKFLVNGVQPVAITEHADPLSGVTVTELATKQNQIILTLRSLGIIASE